METRQENMELLAKVQQVAQRAEFGLDLSVYRPGTVAQVAAPLEAYLARPHQPARRGWKFWERGSQQAERVAPLLLSGPVGTGKTTLMMLLDRALPEVSCAPLFQQEIEAHPSTAENGHGRAMIEVRPLALMGRTHNLPTGVIRLRELQTFYRLYTYDRRAAQVDEEAAERFARFFHHHIIFIDEFVPDTVTAFPMQVINHLADHGVLVVLTSNRRETPFVEGVQVVAVEGEDMRTGVLSLVCRPAGPDPRFDVFEGVEATDFSRLATGLRGRVRILDDGRRWLHLRYDEFARVPADWLTFQQLLQQVEGVLIDELPLFDAAWGGTGDGARRFVFLVDALYDERRPVLIRLTTPDPLPDSFEAEMLGDRYLPEVLVDLERALSRLRQLGGMVALPSPVTAG